ncbi:DNA gyrase inhibitor YacG [Tundrisphaera lichenicola]|uniref:DNA gyrase inhibitor YacG n=1 Tax=Tundrisphaera lichenicola TaxID=2029860 RepID=UPI003EBD467E
MIRGRCPICGKSFEAASLDDHPGFPFCSDRCKLVDLGRWIDGAYAIPASPQPDTTDESEEAEEDGEE